MWPNDNSRHQVANIQSHPKAAKVNKAVIQRLQQIRAAHANGLETFPLFAIAVLVGNYARLPVAQLNSVSSQIVVSRIVFNLVRSKI